MSLVLELLLDVVHAKDLKWPDLEKKSDFNTDLETNLEIATLNKGLL